MYALTKDQSTSLTINVNGETCQMDTADRTLLEVLREDFRLTGTKKACDNGECGSCIVMMNGKPTKSCLLKANRAADRDVMTIEGMAPAAKGIKAGEDISILHPIQQAFLEKGATQCGFCIPGMIMKTANLLQNKPNPTRNEIVKSLSKNLCRCTGYTKILDAVEYAAELINDGRSGVSQGVGDGPAVGGNVSRLDSPGTVTGDAMYAGDMQMEGMLHARLLRSTQHHARIISIDTSEAEAMEGVECVVTADDIPGTPFLPNCQPQVYVFPKDRIRFKGEAIAGVAACTEAIAEEALKKIKVVVEELPHAIEIVDAMRKNAEPMYNHSPRVSPPEEVSCGNIEAGFAKADVIIQNDYTVPVREHAAMEPESALVYGWQKTSLYYWFISCFRSRHRIHRKQSGNEARRRSDKMPCDGW